MSQNGRNGVHTHTHSGMLLSNKKNKATTTTKNEMSLSTTWMDLEGVMPSKTRHTEKDKYHSFIYMWNLRNKIREHGKQDRNRFRDTENKLVVTRGGGSRGMCKTGKGLGATNF